MEKRRGEVRDGWGPRNSSTLMGCRYKDDRVR